LSGGIATVSRELANALAGKGKRVVVHCPKPPEKSGKDLAFRRVKVRGTQDPDDVARWFFIFGRAVADRESLHCVTEPAPVLALLWRIILRRPVPSSLSILLHGTEVLRWRRRGWLVWALRGLARKGCLLVPSAHVRDLVSEVLGTNASLPVVLPYAPPRFCQTATFPTKERPTDSPMTLLTVARIHPRKGQLDVINALCKVNSELTKNLRYRIVGEGKKSRMGYLDALRKAVDQVPFEVTEEGPKYGEDLLQAYRDSDVFVMASRDDPDSLESFGLVYLEAASMGLPILATKVGGVAEACREGALLTEPHSEDALVEDLERLLSDANLRRELGDAGARRTRAMNWSAAANLLLGEAKRASPVSLPTR